MCAAEVNSKRTLIFWGDVKPIPVTPQNSEILKQIDKSGAKVSVDDRATVAAVRNFLSQQMGIPSDSISLQVFTVHFNGEKPIDFVITQLTDRILETFDPRYCSSWGANHTQSTLQFVINKV